MCNHGEVRLFGGYSDHYGVAEVCINGLWADICYNVDRTAVAATFCKQLIGEQSCMCTDSWISIHWHCYAM